MTVALHGVEQGYGTSAVITDLELRLKPGVIGLLGPNGAGKTTLLRTLATVMPPRSGSIEFKGSAIDGERSARRARSSIGYLPQRFGFDPTMRVVDFVQYAAWMRGVPSGEWTSAVDKALDRVDLDGYRRTKMRKLSGGMRQRAGIAWAIVGEPELVLLDEPTVGLDPRQRLQFREIIANLDDSTVILSTHLIDDVEAACTDVIVFYGGSVRFQGTTDELRILGDNDLPGHSDLERAYMSLLPEEEQRL